MGEEEAEKPELALSVALKASGPADPKALEQVATPFVGTTAPQPEMVAPLASKLTDPSGTAPDEEVTVALRVTTWPGATVDAEDDKEVLVLEDVVVVAEV